MLLPGSHGKGLVLLEEEGDAVQPEGVPGEGVGEALGIGVMAPMRPVVPAPEGLEQPTAYPKPF